MTASLDTRARIFVAGAETMIGAAVVRRLRALGCTGLCGVGAAAPELSTAAAVEQFFEARRPEIVVHCAGKSGGIAENIEHPATLMLDNLRCATHVIAAAHRFGTRKLLYLASSCSYPRQCPQPMREEHLLGGPLEPTSEAYAVAKIAGLKLCEAYRREHGADFLAAIPANVFGPGDDFGERSSHVVGALIRRMHRARLAGEREIKVWGSGAPRRELLYVDDLADACCFLIGQGPLDGPLNVGSGEGVSIAELAALVKRTVGFEGELAFDTSKPDGMPVKLLDSSRIRALGWRPRYALEAALASTYRWYLENGAGDAA